MAASGTLKLRAWGFLLAALGGFLIALGALMSWISSRAGAELSLVGIDAPVGMGVLVCGVLIVIGIFAMRFQATMRGRRVVGLFVLLLALATIATTTWALLNLRDLYFPEVSVQIKDFAAQSGMSTQEAERELAVDISTEFGVYLPIVGGVMAVVGAILCLMWAKRRGDLPPVDEEGVVGEEPAGPAGGTAPTESALNPSPESP